MIQLAQQSAETLSANLSNGVVLMLLGMGTVFLFLVILIFVTKGMSSIVRKIEAKRPAPAPAAARPAAMPKTASAAMGTDPEIAAAIVAAVVESKR
ncbi:MAG: OadG family protein [Spirochaetia bacterium]|jgi:oxaloacetate decarboxylase gamma subunit|nr:OadG family protein [Spirochaetia bacterium]